MMPFIDNFSYSFSFSSGVIKRRAKEVRECGQDLDKHLNVGSAEEDKTGSKGSNESGKSDSEGNVKVHSLAVMLLVEFVESLEKAMFNASDGCAVAVSPPNKVSFTLCMYLPSCFYLVVVYRGGVIS